MNYFTSLVLKRIAESTVRRLSLYLSFLEGIERQGTKTISSDDLARIDADPMRCLDADTSAAMVAEVIHSLLPVLVNSGIATEAQVKIDSLQERIQEEIAAARSIAISPSLIGAWSKIP